MSYAIPPKNSVALAESRGSGRLVADGEVSSDPDHDEPASGPNVPMAGDTTNNPSGRTKMYPTHEFHDWRERRCSIDVGLCCHHRSHLGICLCNHPLQHFPAWGDDRMEPNPGSSGRCGIRGICIRVRSQEDQHVRREFGQIMTDVSQVGESQSRVGDGLAVAHSAQKGSCHPERSEGSAVVLPVTANAATSG